MRLARATGGGIDYWIGLPIAELAACLIELVDQLEKEHKAAEEAARRR
jgi:hypothetical protein